MAQAAVSHGTVSRYAVYYAPPPAHPLWAAGCAWLGRDARAGAPATPPARAHVQAPWRYGFHATLKPPCRIAVSEAQWLAAVQALALRHVPFMLPPLQVAVLGDFLALRPVQPVEAAHPLRRLADDCVLRLDPLRAPPTPEEHERQLHGARTARQREQVQRHGYAHVLDDWRFHLTLTDGLSGLDTAGMQALRPQAERHFAAALREPLPCDALSVFVEPAPGQPLQLTHRFPLGGTR